MYIYLQLLLIAKSIENILMSLMRRSGVNIDYEILIITYHVMIKSVKTILFLR